MPNDMFMIAFYNEKKLDKLFHYTLDEIQDIVDSNEGITDAKLKNYIQLEIDKTPDEVKIFAWDNGFIPVCKEINLFATGEDYKKANKPVADELEAARDILKEVRWIDRKFEYDSERELCDLLISLSEDALTLDGKMLFTRDNAQEYYADELQQVKDIYLSMTPTEKDHFRKCFSIGRVKFAHLEYLINYLGIKHILADI